MSKFTAGPLVVKQGPDRTAIGFMRDGKFEATANLVEDDSGSYDTRITVSEAEANARLYSAAPELLQALKRAEHKLSAYVGVCTGDKELTETILPMSRAALAKAEGN